LYLVYSRTGNKEARDTAGIIVVYYSRQSQPRKCEAGGFTENSPN